MYERRFVTFAQSQAAARTHEHEFVFMHLSGFPRGQSPSVGLTRRVRSRKRLPHWRKGGVLNSARYE